MNIFTIVLWYKIIFKQDNLKLGFVVEKKYIERKRKKKIDLGRDKWEGCFGNFLNCKVEVLISF